MRLTMIAMLLCACATFTSTRRLTPVEVEASFKEFSKEFYIEHFDKAKAIADKNKLDRRRVVEFVTTALWQKVILTKEIGVGTVKEISNTFQLDRATQTAFALKVFDFYVVNDFCEIAADTVYQFDLGPAYADKAINCAQSSPGSNYLSAARLACSRPGTKELQRKLINGWVENFKQSSPDKREYYLFRGYLTVFISEYDSMAEVASKCPLTADQYLDLFAIGLKDKKPEFAKAILDKGNFNKTLADYDNFIAMAATQYQCGMAATVALKQKMPDSAIETLFQNPKCLGGTLKEIDLALVPQPKVDWFFNLSLRTHEFVLARHIVKTFSLGKNNFERVVSEGLAAQYYDHVLGFEPWDGERTEDYRDGILNKVLDANEEWAVTRFVVENSTPLGFGFTEIHRNAWIDRAFLHALRRGDFNLAADISRKHTGIGFSDWGTRWAFEGAIQAKNADSARFIAKRWHLDDNALKRVAMLYWEKNKEKARQQALKLKRECEASKDWSSERCK